MDPLPDNNSTDSPYMWIYFANKAGIAQYSDRPRVDAGIRFPPGTRDVSRLLGVQTDSVAHQVSYLVGSGGSFREGKEAWAWSWPIISI
jgi:hypothetical protein